MSKTAAIPMDKEIQSFQFIFTGQQYFFIDFFVLNELTQTPLQKIPSNPQKDTDKQNKNHQTRRELGGFRFPTVIFKTL